MLILSTVCLQSCAHKWVLPNIRVIKKGEPAYIDGYILTENEMQILGADLIKKNKGKL